MTTETIGLSFNSVIDGIKHGFTFRRKQWEKDGIYISLRKGEIPREIAEGKEHIDGLGINLFQIVEQSSSTQMPTIDICVIDGDSMRYIPRQEDLLAEDWEFIVLPTFDENGIAYYG